jgi:DNA-binding NarL/FixJ family response regulator
MRPRRVIVIEDFTVYRDYIVQMLRELGGFEVVGQAACGTEAVDAIMTRPADLIILDLSLPKPDGFDVLELTREHTPAKILMLTLFDAAAYAGRAFDLGVDGFCMKDAGRQEIVNAIYATLDGRRPTGRPFN